MTQPNPAAEQDRRLDICIKTASGGSINHTFNIQQKAKDVVDVAVREFNLDRHPPRPYEVHLEEDGRPGRLLRLDLSLGAQGIKDGDCLIVAPPASPDGC